MKVNDVVQIVNHTHHWFPCLLVVSEIGKHYLQGYTAIPKGGSPPGMAFIRIKPEDVEVIGEAIIVMEHHQSDHEQPSEPSPG